MQSVVKTVSTRGVELATESFGEAVRGTILLVMGSTASMVWWPIPFCRALAEGGYRVIRFDHRDTGASTTGAPGEVAYDVPDLADDLGAILDAYDARAAHVAGMSLGGLAAQLFALQQPERVETLTLISAEPLGTVYEGEGISPAFMAHFEAMGTLDWSDHDAVAAFMLKIAELSAGSAPPFDREASEARVALELSRTSSMQSAFNHAMLQGEIPQGLTAAAIRQPVLVIHGAEDPIISVNAAETSARVIADATLVRLEGRGHELAPVDLGRVAAEILDFISD